MIRAIEKPLGKHLLNTENESTVYSQAFTFVRN